MKKLFIAAAMMFGTYAQALEIEVAPLALQGRAEVMGFEVQVDGSGLIVLTGEAANAVAEAADLAFDASEQMLILTGEEVEKLLDDATKGILEVGEITVVATEAFAKATLDLAKDLAKAGKAVVNEGADQIGEGARRALSILSNASRNSVTLVEEAGVLVLETGRAVVGDAAALACNILGFIGLCE